MIPVALRSAGYRDPEQAGFALAVVLPIMVILTVVGAMVFQNVGTDITHTGKDVKRLRAEFAAESSVEWALAELARKRPASLPFTLATHQSDGVTRMDSGSKDDGSNMALQTSDLSPLPEAKCGIDDSGWIFQSTTNSNLSISSGSSELLAFKVWYPNDSTMRISGRANVDGVQADLELVSTLKEFAVPF